MKRMIVLVLISMLLSLSTAFAYSDASNADAKNVLDSIKEIRYNVEAGVNFNDYSSLVSKAIINFKKHKEMFPDNDKDSYLEMKFKTLLADYNDAQTIWQDALYSNLPILHDADIKILKSIHPSLQVEKIPNDITGGYYAYKDVLQGLWSVAAEDEKSLTENTRNQQPDKSQYPISVSPARP